MSKIQCTVETCEREHHSNGLCTYHNKRQWAFISDAPISHGTLSAYVNRRCRCADCREASAAYTRERRAEKKAAA